MGGYDPTYVCTVTTTSAYMGVSEETTTAKEPEARTSTTERSWWDGKLSINRGLFSNQSTHLIAPCQPQESGWVVIIDNDIIVHEMSAKREMERVEKPT